MKKVAVHLAEGFEEIEAITIIDVLRRAGLNVIMVSITGQLAVNGAHDIPVVVDVLFEGVDYSEIDMIVLPGGMPGSKNLDEHEGLRTQIKIFAEQEKLLGAICAAPLVFGNIGLLQGKDAVCYPRFEKFLEGATLKKQLVVVDGNIVTGKGVGAALKFALKIVEKLVSKEKAEELGEAMLVI